MELGVEDMVKVLHRRYEQDYSIEEAASYILLAFEALKCVFLSRPVPLYPFKDVHPYQEVLTTPSCTAASAEEAGNVGGSKDASSGGRFARSIMPVSCN